MTATVFRLLEAIGFTHPVHPALTHLPMGMAMGCILFGIAALFLRRISLEETAHHCAILGLIGVPPTMLAGYLDWQHSWEGEWIFWIQLKIVLGFLLFFLFLWAVWEGRKDPRRTRLLMAIYGLCLLCAIGLGFSGGELMYG